MKMLETPLNWLGYLGWLLFFSATMLYYRLWLSSGAAEMRLMNEELRKARRTIAKLESLELTLKNRNDELHTINTRLHAEYVELRGQFSQLSIAYGKLGEQVGDLKKDLLAERKLREDQFMQLLRERAKNGDL